MRGKPGIQVTIRGASFTKVVSVLFNGKRAAFKVKCSTIAATVPAGSRSGKITVRTQTGTAVTVSRFTVTA